MSTVFIARVGGGGCKTRESGVMAKHLTDKQKKRIIADYVELGSYNAVAKKYKIADTTVKRIVQASPETQKKAEDKKEQNTKDILSHMEKSKDKVCLIVDKYLDALLDPTKIEKATTAQLTTALGTLIDKWTAITGSGGTQDREDGLSKSLRELGEELVSDD